MPAPPRSIFLGKYLGQKLLSDALNQLLLSAALGDECAAGAAGGLAAAVVLDDF